MHTPETLWEARVAELHAAEVWVALAAFAAQSRRDTRPAARAFWPCAVLAAMAGCSPADQISDSGFGAYEVSLAAWSDGLAVAWYDTRDGNAEVYVRPLDADGREAGPELRLTTTAAESYEADIAPLTDAFAIAWYEKEHDGAMRAQLGVWQRDGTPVWTTPVAVGAGVEPQSRRAQLRRRACFARGSRPTATAASPFGAAGGSSTGGRAAHPCVSAPPARRRGISTPRSRRRARRGSCSTRTPDTRVEELFVATLAEGRATLARLTADDGIRSKYPDIALGAGGRGAITWFDERDGNREVYLAAAPVDGVAAADRGARASCHDDAGRVDRRVSRFERRSHRACVVRRQQRQLRSVLSVVRCRRQSAGAAAPAQRYADELDDPGDRAVARRLRVGVGRGGARAARSAHSEDTRAEVVFTTVRP